MNSALRIVALLPLLLWMGCSRQVADDFQGYIEGEYVYVSAPVSGALQMLAVSRGDEVRTGEPLFELEPEPEGDAVREAEQKVAQTEARLANLTKGARPSEIAALEARLASALADAEFAESEVKRFTQLKEERVISPDEMERAQTRRNSAVATVASLQAELETARLGARSDEIEAARSEVEVAKAALSRAQWTLTQKQQTAPTNAVVDDTLYRVGEWVAAGKPVVSLLPPQNIKLRFFVPEPELSSVQQGRRVSLSFDGSEAPVEATINYISTQAEFTPPVIYSRENRAKLVYMVEARFSANDATSLHPGQPVDVHVLSEAP